MSLGASVSVFGMVSRLCVCFFHFFFCGVFGVFGLKLGFRLRSLDFGTRSNSWIGFDGSCLWQVLI